jgi:23S rRNA pseudouridine1911/1915/1917 synthase
MVCDAIPRTLDGERLDRVVAFISDVSRKEAAALVVAGAVQVDGTVIRAGKRRVQAGQEVAVDLTDRVRDRTLAADPGVEFEVVHDDEAVIVVDKPAGVVVHPGAGNRSGTLVQGLLARYPEIADVGDPQRPGIVHRLDVGSSGLLVVARTGEAHESLSQQFRTRRAGRTYRAVVWGHPTARVGVIDAPIGRSPRDPLRRAVVAAGKPARTHYRVLAELTGPADVAELGCTLDTGRTHQIRVHLESVGHPLVGDTLYGRGRPVLGLTRPFLHAAELTIDHPTSGDRITWTSRLPPDLVALRSQFIERAD